MSLLLFFQSVVADEGPSSRPSSIEGRLYGEGTYSSLEYGHSLPVRTAWRIFDPVTQTSFVLPRNPSSVTLPDFAKTTSFSTTSSTGALVRLEKPNQFGTLSMEGVLLTAQEWQDYTAWFHLKGLVRITDDLGREWWGFFRTFSAKRVRDLEHPLCYRYTAEMLVSDRAAEDLSLASNYSQLGE